MKNDRPDTKKKAPEAKSSPADTLSEQRRAKAKSDILEALERAGGHVGKASQAGGIHRATFYEWMKADPEFKKACSAVVEHKVDNVEYALYSNAIKGNVVAQIFYLKNKRSDTWKDQTKLDARITGDVNLLFEKKPRQREAKPEAEGDN